MPPEQFECLDLVMQLDLNTIYALLNIRKCSTLISREIFCLTEHNYLICCLSAIVFRACLRLNM